jgi:hypothetical protein
MGKPIKHYLLTVPMLPQQARLHCYLICSDKKYIHQVINKMMDIYETTGCRPRLPIILQTELNSGVELVREVAGEANPGFNKLIAEATDFHVSICSTPIGHPKDELLMALH